MIQADASQMRQVLTNLLDNAAAAVVGDRIDVSVEAKRDSDFDTILFRDTGPGVPAPVRRTLFEPLVTTRAKGTGLGLTICRQIVQAHGGGISAAVQERIFDPFFTTTRPGRGTGLGLPISHTIVRDHGGELWLGSEVGKHTRFHVELPPAPGQDATT